MDDRSGQIAANRTTQSDKRIRIGVNDDPTNGVPEGGSFAVVFGMAMLGPGLVRRRFQK